MICRLTAAFDEGVVKNALRKHNQSVNSSTLGRDTSTQLNKNERKELGLVEHVSQDAKGAFCQLSQHVDLCKPPLANRKLKQGRQHISSRHFYLLKNPIVNRKEERDCLPLNGTMSLQFVCSYEAKNAPAPEGKIGHRKLACACLMCLTGMYPSCVKMSVVGKVTYHSMKLKPSSKKATSTPTLQSPPPPAPAPAPAPAQPPASGPPVPDDDDDVIMRPAGEVKGSGDHVAVEGGSLLQQRTSMDIDNEEDQPHGRVDVNNEEDQPHGRVDHADQLDRSVQKGERSTELTRGRLPRRVRRKEAIWAEYEM